MLLRDGRKIRVLSREIASFSDGFHGLGRESAAMNSFHRRAGQAGAAEHRRDGWLFVRIPSRD
jgi:hypothetical protein